jgi:hypothetical protein
MEILWLAFLTLGIVVALNASQLITDAGLTPAQQAGITAADTFTFPNDGKIVLLCVHGAGASNLTIVTPGTVRGKAIADTVVALTAAGTTLVGPFPPDLYNDPATGLVTASVSEATGFTVAALRLP